MQTRTRTELLANAATHVFAPHRALRPHRVGKRTKETRGPGSAVHISCVRWVPWCQPRRGAPDRPKCPRMFGIQDADAPSIRSRQFQKSLRRQSCPLAPSRSVAACAGQAGSGRRRAATGTCVVSARPRCRQHLAICLRKVLCCVRRFSARSVCCDWRCRRQLSSM